MNSLLAIFDPILFSTLLATLFVIMDPPGTIPIFLALTSTFTSEGRKRAARQAALVSLGVILVFGILGRYILEFLHISLPALQLSGGFLLFLVAMELLMGKNGADDGHSQAVNVALVPLGTPLLAGPGAIVATMVATQSSSGDVRSWVSILSAILVMHFTMWVTMHFAGVVHRILGEGGTLIVSRLAGLLLAAIATQMMVDAIYAFISSYAAPA